MTNKLNLPYKIIIGTHHKTGTQWLNNIFISIAKKYKLKLFYGQHNMLPSDYDLFFQDHSNFDFSRLMSPFRGIHMIRDPRDVIISGCFYHQTSSESWLHRPIAVFDGMSYQQKLKSFPTEDEKILFEMRQIGRSTIFELTAWKYDRADFCELKYEDLIGDPTMKAFKEMFEFMEFPPAQIPDLLSIAYDNCLFSGKVKSKGHVRSGKSGQWKEYFTPEHKSEFIHLFGEALVTLGYELDNSWAGISKVNYCA